MFLILLTYLKKPVNLTRWKVILLALGCIGFLSIGFIYDRQIKKNDQYGELNTFLENRIKALHGERTLLEKSLQDAIDNGLKTQTEIENRYEKDKKDMAVWADTANGDSHTDFFKKRIGNIRQYQEKH